VVQPPTAPPVTDHEVVEAVVEELPPEDEGDFELMEEVPPEEAERPQSIEEAHEELLDKLLGK